MFYELYRDQGNIVYGGKWFNPVTMEMIEVIDLDSASGVDGTSAIERGPVYIDEDRLREAGKSLGWEFQAPQPPPMPEGPREWMPRSYSKKWEPPPQPGNLFWVPETPLIEKIAGAWRRFGELEREHRFDTEKAFLALDPEKRELVLQGADGIHSYYGFDGGSDRRHLVIEKGSDSEEDADSLIDQWGARDAVVAKDPRKAVWKILKELGVKRPKNAR